MNYRHYHWLTWNPALKWAVEMAELRIYRLRSKRSSNADMEGESSEVAMAGASAIHAHLEHLLWLKRQIPPPGSRAAEEYMANEDLVCCLLILAKMAAKNLRAHRNALLFFKLVLPDEPPSDDGDLIEAFFSPDLGPAADYLFGAIELAVDPWSGVDPDNSYLYWEAGDHGLDDMDFIKQVLNVSILYDDSLDENVTAENLYEALLARTETTDAHQLLQSAYLAVKLAQKHILLCVAAPLEHNPAAGSIMEQILTRYNLSLDLANLAIKHVDLAANILSSSYSTIELAAISQFAEKTDIVD